MPITGTLPPMSRFAVIPADRPRAVMGIVNVTPDSFSDGGRFVDRDPAVRHARALVAAGADVLDVGGESTRPGADPVTADEELARVEPVIAAIAGFGVPVSVDTTKADVAERALAAGASIVNDVSGGRNDPRMLDVVAAVGAGFVIMHMQGAPRTMQVAPHYGDVVAEVSEFLAARVEAAVAAGIDRDRILVDPGIGFGKTVAHNLALLRGLGSVRDATGAPVLVGASRKGFLGALLGEPAVAPDARDDATTATTVWAFTHGAAMVRVHDVTRARAAADLLTTLHSTSPGGKAA